MNGFIWVVGGGTVLFAAVVSYAMTRRYGWGTALTLPVLALAAMLAMQWQEQDSRPGTFLDSLLYASPVLLGALAGIALARLRRA